MWSFVRLGSILSSLGSRCVVICILLPIHRLFLLHSSCCFFGLSITLSSLNPSMMCLAIIVLYIVEYHLWCIISVCTILCWAGEFLCTYPYALTAEHCIQQFYTDVICPAVSKSTPSQINRYILFMVHWTTHLTISTASSPCVIPVSASSMFSSYHLPCMFLSHISPPQQHMGPFPKW